jgi:hypothetical protein
MRREVTEKSSPARSNTTSAAGFAMLIIIGISELFHR